MTPRTRSMIDHDETPIEMPPCRGNSESCTSTGARKVVAIEVCRALTPAALVITAALHAQAMCACKVRRGHLSSPEDKISIRKFWWDWAYMLSGSPQ